MDTKQNLDEPIIGANESFELIDLQPFGQDMEGFQLDEDGISSNFLSELISDESLYTRYLNGAISFDDLMREMHKKELQIFEQPSLNESTSDRSSDSEDPAYVPPTRSSSKRRGSANRRMTGSRRGRKSHRGTKMDRRGRKSTLPIELNRYLGEAERCLNSEQFDDAEKICLEIIETAPYASQPYIVMADINHRRGNMELCIEYLVKAAERNPSNTNNWMTLADLAEEKDDTALAMHYTRIALRYARDDPLIRQRLIDYCEKAGRTREGLTLRLSSLSINPQPNGELQFKVARELAHEFFKLSDPSSCIKAYRCAFEKYPDHGSGDDKNSALTLMIQTNRYDEALQFFVDFCDVNMYLKTQEHKLDPDQLQQYLATVERFEKCEYPKTLPPELCVKLFMVLSKLGLGSLILSDVENSMTRDNVSKFSEWYLELFRSLKTHGLLMKSAFKALQKLTQLHPTSKIPEVWMWLAEYYLEVDQAEESIKAYRHVIETLDPRHTDARLALVSLLKRLGRHQEAINMIEPTNLLMRRKSVKGQLCQANSSKRSVSFVLPKTTTNPKSDVDMDATSLSEDSAAESGDELKFSNDQWLQFSANLVSHDPVAYRLAYEKCRMLDTPATIDSFLRESWTLLFSDVTRVCGLKYTQLALVLDSSRHRKVLMDRLASAAPFLTDGHQEFLDSSYLNQNELDNQLVTSWDIWGLFLRVVEVLQTRLPKSLPQLETATAWACLLPHVQNNDLRRVAASHLLISSSLVARHGVSAVIELRGLHKQWAHKNQYWNVLNQAIHLAHDFKQNRFLDRLVAKDPSNFGACLLACNETLVRGSFRYAVARLIWLREKCLNNPLISLLLAVGFLNLGLQKHVSSRHPSVLQAIGFLGEYRRLRGECQEVYYNIARACHQLKLGHVALPYYEKVIDMEPVGSTDQEKAVTDLRQEAAFNLMVLYRSSGNVAMARHIIQNYLVV